MTCSECGLPITRYSKTGKCRSCAQPHRVTDLKAYVMSRVTVTNDGHWLWDGPTNPDGYGVCSRSIGGLGEQRAHRLSWRVFVGDIAGEIGHVCRINLCVRPDPAHLEDVTHRVNMTRAPHIAAQVAQTTCLRGHEFTPENTYMSGRDNRRHCRECRRTRQRNKRIAN